MLPAQETGHELSRRHPAEDALKGVMRGNPVRQPQPVGEPVIIDLNPMLSLILLFRVTDDRAKRNHDDTEPLMMFEAVNLRINEVRNTVGRMPDRREDLQGHKTAHVGGHPAALSDLVSTLTAKPSLSMRLPLMIVTFPLTCWY